MGGNLQIVIFAACSGPGDPCRSISSAFWRQCLPAPRALVAVGAGVAPWAGRALPQRVKPSGDAIAVALGVGSGVSHGDQMSPLARAIHASAMSRTSFSLRKASSRSWRAC